MVREGLRPSLKSLPPLLGKERGIKGVRLTPKQAILGLIKNLKQCEQVVEGVRDDLALHCLLSE